MKERFCWNCKHEKYCQSYSVITDEDCSICSRHKFFDEKEKKSDSPMKKKGLTKQNKFDIMMSEIVKVIKKFCKK